MKILILANHDLGLYKFRKELLKALLEKHQVYVSVPEGVFTDKFIEMGCQVINTSFDRRSTSIINDLKLYKKYQEMINNIKPDVVFTYTIKPNIYGGLACQHYKIPYICNITGLGSAVENPGILQLICLTLYKLGLRKARKVFFQNKANQDFFLSKRIINKNYDLLPGSGVNLTEFVPEAFPDDEEIGFTYVGRIMKEKGFDQYIAAAEYIKNKYPKTVFHVCGPYEDDYKQIVENLIKEETIVYDGYVEDMKEIYKKIQCTIHPTYYPEGMSNVLLETLASARAIITTNRPGCREIIEDGINGFVVEEKNEKDLIAKIEMFLALSNKQRAQLGINGRKKVEKEFDRNIVINKYLSEIY